VSQPAPGEQAQPSTLSPLNKIGLVVALLLGLVDCVGLVFPTPAGQVGPPLAITILGAVLGVITVVCVVMALRRANKGAVRIAAGARIIAAITSLPAFFAGVPTPLLLFVSGYVVLTVAAVILMLTPTRRSVSVLD